MSFGSCEAINNSSTRSFWYNTWQQAAAQGISVFVSSGDSGSAGCENPHSSSLATRGFGVNVIASTPYNVAVGGTEFNENGADSVYWSKVNDLSNSSSAKGYIPEVVWNESGAAIGGKGLWSGGGGISTLYRKPSWQTGYGVPAADYRYLPDVSLTAAGHDGYVTRILQDGSLQISSGTSASSPAFAGIMAIVNQVTNQANGNPNPRLYALAAEVPSAFHDVTQGSNAVPCTADSPNCFGEMVTGYNAGPGYDLATGWGSVDAYVLAHAWVASQPGVNGSPTGTITASPEPCAITSTPRDCSLLSSLGSGSPHAKMSTGPASAVCTN